MAKWPNRSMDALIIPKKRQLRTGGSEMFVFIDESGDSGFKFSGGSSQYFTCVAVIFSDALAADACDRRIEQVRRELNLRPSFEFHFTECSTRVRTAFLQAVAFEKFAYHGFVLNKRRLYGQIFKDQHGFYDFTVGLICENARPFLKDAKIVIDECGDRNFKRRLQASLKARMTDEEGNCLIRKVAMEESHTNNLIQLADMVCGAVARSYNSQKDDREEFRKLVKRRELRVQFWPK